MGRALSKNSSHVERATLVERAINIRGSSLVERATLVERAIDIRGTAKVGGVGK